MRKTRTLMLAVLLLCAAASTAFGRYAWYWTLPTVVQSYILVSPPVSATDSANVYFYLTKNNGSHAVAMSEYGHVPCSVEIRSSPRITLDNIACFVNFCWWHVALQRRQQRGNVPIAVYSAEALLDM